MATSGLFLRSSGRPADGTWSASGHRPDGRAQDGDDGRSRLPPGSLRGGPFGSIPEYRLDPAGFLWRRYWRHGRAFKTRLGSPTVFLIGPDANRFILHEHPELFSVGEAWPSFLRFMLGDDAMSMKDGHDYQRLRAVVAPAFAASTLKRLLEEMAEVSDAYLDEWSQSGPVQFLTEARPLVLEVICRWVLGEPDSVAEAAWLRQRVDRFTSVPSSRHEVGARGGGGQAETWMKRAARDQLEAYVIDLVERRRHDPRDDALSLMCHHPHGDGDGLSNEELAAQALMLLSAGTDSTASTLTWLLLALDTYPSVRRALADEIEGCPDALEWSELRRLPYLACVFKEVERMYPVALAPGRVARDDFEFDGYVIPRGWMVRYCILLTHFMPEVFADPTAFEPARFLPPREEDRKTPFSLLGFGAGPRHCIGKPLARLFLQAFVVTLMRDYSFVVLPDQDVTPVLDNNTTFKPRSRLWVQFAPARSRRRHTPTGR